MKKENKELLLKDLSARLPYGLIANVFSYWNDEWVDEKILGIDLEDDDVLVDVPGGRSEINLVKPYLRPLSSMTVEEKSEYKDFYPLLPRDLMPPHIALQMFDWLNKHHFDYRGLIEKNLALPAPEGMYNLNKEEKK